MMKASPPKFFNNKISSENDLDANIIIQFKPHEVGDQCYLIQNFIIFPNNIVPYLNCESKIKSIIMKNYINKLYIGDIDNEHFIYEKTVEYESNVFDVYYKTNKCTHSQIKNTPMQLQVKIPKQYIIEEKDLMKCETCVCQFNCDFKKRHKGAGCQDWNQL